MARGHPISKDVVNQIVKMVGEGASIRSISDAMGIDARRVRERLKTKVKVEKVKTPLEDELQKRRDEGMLLREIADLYNIKYYTVKRLTKQPQIKAPSRHPCYTPHEEMELIRKRRREGSAMRAIAREFNRSMCVVKRACSEINDENKKKKDDVKKAFISAVVSVAVSRKSVKLQVPEHVTRMKLSLMMTRGFSESEALAQAMNHYARGKVTPADDDYQPRKMVIRRRV